MKKIALIVALLALIGGGWYYTANRESSPSSPTQDGVVARVNGEEITETELETFQSQVLAQQGIDVSVIPEESRASIREQALNDIISQTLISQAIVSANITVTPEEVDEQMDIIKTRFESVEAYEAELAAQNLTEAELRERVESDLQGQRFLEQELNLSALTATDAEIETFYNEQVAGVEGAPTLEEAEVDIATYLAQQKQQERLVLYVEELRAEADIEIL